MNILTQAMYSLLYVCFSHILNTECVYESSVNMVVYLFIDYSLQFKLKFYLTYDICIIWYVSDSDQSLKFVHLITITIAQLVYFVISAEVLFLYMFIFLSCLLIILIFLSVLIFILYQLYR